MIEDPADRHEGDRVLAHLLLTYEETIVLDRLTPLMKRIAKRLKDVDPGEPTRKNLRHLTEELVAGWMYEVERMDF